MKHQRDANGASNVGLGQAAQITALISDLRRIDHLIERDIAREEKEAGVFDLSSAAYPIMGRILRVRRNNLANTIATLGREVCKSSRRATEPSNPVLKTRFAGQAPFDSSIFRRAVSTSRINPQRRHQA